MPAHLSDPVLLAVVAFGAFAAGFTTGFAGFGTGLVASGFWFHALPAAMVPPLAAMAAVAGQLMGLATVRTAFAWRRCLPFLTGGIIGIPFGVLALTVAAPGLLRVAVGGFLVAYAALQFAGTARLAIGERGGRALDGAVGAGGGVLGGFAGLSGPLPVVFLQMRGWPAAEQRGVYQPFNLVILAIATGGMALGGAIDRDVLIVAAVCLPMTLLGAWAGARSFAGTGETTFRRVVLGLLLISGAVLVGEAVI